MSAEIRLRSLSGILLLLLLLPALLIAVESFTGKCVSVTDGDTIGVLKDGKEIKIRLDGIDCPESGQDFGSKAKKFTSALCFSKEVQVKAKELDKYGRTVARVIVDGKNLSLELVKAGLAWHYVQYSSDTVLANAEKTARMNEDGLWGLVNPVAPWEYRNGVSEKEAVKKIQTQQAEPKQDTTTVYVTKSGAKYHRAGCQYLRKSMIPTAKSDAVSRGYLPCSKCRP